MQERHNLLSNKEIDDDIKKIHERVRFLYNKFRSMEIKQLVNYKLENPKDTDIDEYIHIFPSDETLKGIFDEADSRNRYA